MKIANLTLYNFKCFEGKHEFGGLDNVSPDKPIVLLGGLNGAGKTTFLESVLLCLYGRQSNLWPTKGAKREDYASYVLAVTNNRAKLRIQTEMWIQLDISGVEFGQIEHSMSIKRTWAIKKGVAEEKSVEIVENGKPVEYIEGQYDDFIKNELVPQEIASFFFFDGERIQEIVKDSDKELASSLESALGLTLYKTLQKDLVTVERQISLKSKENNELRKQLHAAEGDILAIEADIQSCREKIAGFEEKAQEIEEDLTDTEVEIKRITHLGAVTKEEYEKQKKQSLVRKGELESEFLREIKILPFIMLTQLGQELSEQLNCEEEYSRALVSQKTAQEKIRPIVMNLFYKGEEATPPILSKQKEFYANKLRNILQDVFISIQSTPVEMIHELSSNNISTIKRNLTIRPDIISNVTKQIDELQKIEFKLRDIQRNEQRAASPETAKLYQQFGSLRLEKELIETTLNKHRKTLKDLELKLASAQKKCNQLSKDLAKSQDIDSQVTYCQKLREVIEEYTERLKVRKVKLLADYMLEMWTLLARKKDLITRIEIDDKRFDVSLYNSENILLDKTKLSAGEKELLAISLIWGLSRLTNRQLPIIIDTPLGRLDAEHRAHISTHYFPRASHQVILLSTNTEIVNQEYKAIAPFVSKTYLIEKKPHSLTSQITEGRYFDV